MLNAFYAYGNAGGVSAAQFGGQADAGEGWLPLEANQKGLTRVPLKSAFP